MGFLAMPLVEEDSRNSDDQLTKFDCQEKDPIEHV